MRRALRIVRHVVVITILVVALLLVGVVGVLHTDWGRERVRRQAEARLEEVFYGDVRIGKITGSVLSRFTAHGFELRNDRGEIVIAADKMTIDYKLLALLTRKFNARQITLEKPVVRAFRNEEGKINLADLLRPSPPSSGDESKQWGVQIDELVITDGELKLDDEMTGDTLTLQDLELTAAFRAEGSRKAIDVKTLSVLWVEKDLPIYADGHFVADEGQTSVSAANIRAGDSHLSVPLFHGRLPNGELAGTIVAVVTEEDLERFFPGAPWARDVNLGIAVGRSVAGEPLAVVLGGAYGEATMALHATVRPELPAGKAHIAILGLEPPTRRPFPGDVVSGTFDLEVGGKTLEGLFARVDGELRGQLGGVRVTSAKLAAKLDKGVGTLRVDADTTRGDALVDARLHMEGPAWILDGARVTAHLGDLRRTVARPGLGGAADVELQAKGRLYPATSLAASGRVRGRKVHYQETSLDEADVTFSATGIPSAPAGKAHVTAKGVRQGTNYLGDVEANAVATDRGRTVAVDVKTGGKGAPHSLTADAVVRLDKRRTTVSLGGVRLVTRGLVWSGRGGKVMIEQGGAVSVDDVALASAAGRVAVEGDLPGKRGRTAAGEKIHVHVTRLDLSRAQKALAPEMQPIAGVLDVDAHVTRKRRNLAFDAKLSVTKARARRDLPPLDVKLDATLGDGRVTGEVWVRDPRTGGALQLTVDGAAPRDPTDVRAWRRVDLRDVDKLRLDLYDLNVGKLMALAGRKSPVQAMVNGSIALADGGRAVDGDLHVRKLTVGPVTDLDSHLKVTWDQDDLTATIASSMGGAKLAEVDAKVEVGLAELQRGRRDFTNAPFEAHLVVDGYPIEKLRPLMDLDTPMSGKLSVDATAGGTVANLTGDATVRLENGQLARVPIRELVANASLRKDELRLALKGVQGRGGRLDAHAELARGGSGAYAVEVDAHKFDLAILGVVAPDAGHPLWGVGGLLDGDLAFRGTKARPGAIDGHIRVANGRFRLMEGQPITDLALVASAKNGRVVISKLSARSGNGKLDAHGEGTLDGILPRSFWVEVKGRRIPINAGRMVVGVTVDGRLEGKQGDQVWTMTADVRGATIDLPRQRRTADLQKTGPLEDVVYVDARGRKKAAELRKAENGPDTRSLVTIDINARRPVAVRGREVRADVRVDVIATYRAKGMSIDGVMEVQRGDLELFGRRYEIQKARIGFRGETPINPAVDVRLAHEFRTATVFINVTGTMNKPKLVLTSDPASYDEAQLLGFVLGGDPDDPAMAERTLDDRAVGVFSSVLAGAVQKQLEKALPIDVLRLDVDEQGGTSSVEVGKWVTDDVFLSYRYRFGSGVEDRNLNEASLEYRFARRWLIDLFFGDRGAGGADLLWTKRY